MTIKADRAAIGGMGKASKMPGTTHGTDWRNCQRGSVLAKIPGTVCSKCYVPKYLRYPSVAPAWARRESALENRFRFARASIRLFRKSREPFHRWKDSGDIQSIDELRLYAVIAKACPATMFWLPTHEPSKVRKCLRKYGPMPHNLIVRISQDYLERSPAKGWPLTSTVGWSDAPFTCPSLDQGNSCKDCRACWDTAVPNINYRQH